MTEEEKALAGYLYDAQEESLGKERLRSQELSFDYNSLRPSQTEEREAIIRREMKKTGKKFRIEAPFYCDFWGRVTLGENYLIRKEERRGLSTHVRSISGIMSGSEAMCQLCQE